ncbi:unnamed protein product [Colias eurytheme]|nr:unnamed protein product [Colias eurytheme]
MGAKFTKKNSFAKNCEQLIEESNLARILKQEHRQILEDNVSHSSNEASYFNNWLRCRYQDTLNFDHNRVILPTEDGESDFINASHVDGYNVKGRFLCTQAPLQETAQDFWKMVPGDRHADQNSRKRARGLFPVLESQKVRKSCPWQVHHQNSGNQILP